MAMSEPGEMSASDGNPIVVVNKNKKIGKFDMHTHTSKLSHHTLDQLVVEYGIPSELNPILPPNDMTMNELKSDKICLYVQQIKLGVLGFLFRLFCYRL